MAELTLGVLQVVVPVATDAIERLCKCIRKKIGERKERKKPVEEGLEEGIDKLLSYARLFRGLCEGDANRTGQHPTLQAWIEELKEILYDAEDLLDEHATDMAVRDMEESGTAVEEIAKSDNGVDAASTTTVSKGTWKAKVRRAFDVPCSCLGRTVGNSPNNCGDIVSEPVVVFTDSVRRMIGVLEEHGRKRALLGLPVVAESQTTKKSTLHLKSRDTTSTLEPYPMVGRGDDMRKIKQALLQGCGLDKEEKMVEGTSATNHNQRPWLCVIPIVGMGGIGKTTLARNLYNDDGMQDLFDLRAWVCGSDNFDKLAILRKTINSIYFFQGRGEECKWSDLQQIEDELVKLVRGHSLLLVLDDIWTDERVEWASLLNTLEAAARNMGACAILVTSRIVSINRAIRGCLKPTHLESLQEDDLWTVFEEYAFENMSLSGYEHERLKSIGEGICKKLKGSPLAAKSIGTLVASEHTVEHWEAVAGSGLWEVAKNELDIIPILKLSYEYLPGYLKQCLHYLSLFPKDRKMEESDIVHLWMAHNCIQRERNDQAVEDTGKKYLEFLVGRSFLELEVDKYYYRYTMHDLIHDTLQSVSIHEFCLLGQEIGPGRAKEIIPVQVRHVSHFSDFLIPEEEEWSSFVMEIKDNALKYKKLRSLVWMGPRFYNPVGFGIADGNLDHLLSHLTFLRVLVLKNSLLKDLPKSTGNLKHLRLLDLSLNYLEKLPESIGLLHNLTVLNLDKCGKLKRLPYTTSRLVNLRHLYYDKGVDVKGIGRLVSLRSNLWFNVKEESGFYMDELKCLNELRGSLEIRNLDIVRSQEDAEAAHICKKMHLKRLTLSWSRGRNIDSPPFETVAREEYVVEALKPCQAINSIKIFGYGGRNSPSWLNDKWLISLKSIELVDVYMENLSSTLSKMPFLEKLVIKGAPNLREMRWQTEVSDSLVVVLFPMLETLSLIDMSACEGLRIEGKAPACVNLPKLKKLTLPRLEECFSIEAPVLEELSIGSVPYFLLSYFQQFPYLTSLELKKISLRFSVHAFFTELILRARSTLVDLFIRDIQGVDNELLASFLSSGSSGGLTSLRMLEITSCPNITLCDLSALTSLKKVCIKKCENITACRLPPAPAALELLSIIECHRMAAVWLSSPPLSIDSLRIYKCSSEQLSKLLHAIYYTNLETLHIVECSDIEHFNDDGGDLQLSTAMLQLTSLKNLLIGSCDKLQSLPPDISNELLCLEEIMIFKCPLLSSLPDLHSLPSLRALEIEHCPQLENSPDVDLLISSKNLSPYVTFCD